MSGTSAVIAERLARWGQALLGLAMFALAAGGTIVSQFFPEREGEGLSTPLLVLLVPIWAVGGAGILLCLAAWVMYPRLTSELNLDLERREDGLHFGRLTRVLACVVLAIFCLGAFGLAASPEEASSPWLRWGIAYFAVCLWGFTVYLSFFYVAERHLATTTLLNLLSPLLAYLLVPLHWPVLVWLNKACRDER